MRDSVWSIPVILLMACADPSSGTQASIATCELADDPPCGAPSQALTAGPAETSAPSVFAGITYAIAGPGSGQRGYVVFVPDASGTHTLYFGADAPLRVCDEEALCSSAITSCGGELRHGTQYAMTAGLPYVIELKPTAPNQPFRLHITGPTTPPPTGGDVKLAAPLFYAAGTLPGFITPADLDGDGALDLVVSNTDDASGDNWLDFMRGTAEGAFAMTNPVTVSAPGQTVVADFSGDGIADVIGVAWDGQGPLPHFYLRGNGDYTFEPKEQWLAGRELTRYLDAADFNEDGTLDLLAPFFEGESTGVSGFVIVGMPGFSILQDQSVFEGAARNAVAGDFNSDGHQDVLVSNVTEPVVHLYLGDGSGTVAFDQAIALPLATGVRQLEAFDLDGNGRTDFVAFDTGGLVASVTLSTATGFQSQLLPDARPNVAAGDFDHDGRIDLVTTSWEQADTLNFYLATDAGFELADSRPALARWLETADVNGDGRIDLLTSYGQYIAVFLGTP